MLSLKNTIKINIQPSSALNTLFFMIIYSEIIEKFPLKFPFFPVVIWKKFIEKIFKLFICAISYC